MSKKTHLWNAAVDEGIFRQFDAVIVGWAGYAAHHVVVEVHHFTDLVAFDLTVDRVHQYEQHDSRTRNHYGSLHLRMKQIWNLFENVCFTDFVKLMIGGNHLTICLWHEK